MKKKIIQKGLKNYGKYKVENTMLKISQNIAIIKINLNRLNFIVNRVCQIGLKIYLYTVYREKNLKSNGTQDT